MENQVAGFQTAVLEHLEREQQRAEQMSRIEEKLDQQNRLFSRLESRLKEQDERFTQLQKQLDVHDDYFAMFLETLNRHHADIKRYFEVTREDARAELELTREMCYENKERIDRVLDDLEGIKRKAEHLDIRMSVTESKAG